MSKKTILLVPPRGIPVKSIRIRLSVAVAFLMFVSIGFIGYFIPFNKITLSDIEQIQKKNLTEQNNALLQKILASLRLLNNLKEQVSRLEMKKENVSQQAAFDSSVYLNRRAKVDVDEMSADELVRYVQNQELQIKNFLAVTNDENNIFDKLPVVSPVSEPYVISRIFGVTVDPFTGTEKGHYGVDFVAEEGSYVFATADGVVERVENHPVWGKRVTISHNNGLKTIYAHLGGYQVKRGKKLVRGDIVGTTGISGLSTGPHLHYEITINGSPINPFEYIFPMITDKFTLNLH